MDFEPNQDKSGEREVPRPPETLAFEAPHLLFLGEGVLFIDLRAGFCFFIFLGDDLAGSTGCLVTGCTSAGCAVEGSSRRSFNFCLYQGEKRTYFLSESPKNVCVCVCVCVGVWVGAGA